MESGSSSDKHDTVSDHHGLDKLDNISDEFGYDLHVSVSQCELNEILRFTIVDERYINTWEQVILDTFEKWEIML